MAQTDNIQADFMRLLKEKLNPKVSFAEKIAELLDISADSAYRRIRGEKELTLQEAKILADGFHISLDSFISGGTSQDLGFIYKALDDKETTFENYLSALHKDLQEISFYDHKEIIYAAKDIPIFHHFNFPELAGFKIFYWMKSIMNIAAFETMPFDLNLVNQKFIEIGKKIINDYQKVPTTEIWTEETVNSTVKQIEYYWESGFFKTTQDALLICDQLSDMLNHIKKQSSLEKSLALHGEPKENAASFKLYYSEVMIGNNNVFVEIDGKQVTYISHNTLNYLITSNENFCAETLKSLKNLIKKSILISGTSEKHRNIFFNKSQQLISNLKIKIAG